MHPLSARLDQSSVLAWSTSMFLSSLVAIGLYTSSPRRCLLVLLPILQQREPALHHQGAEQGLRSRRDRQQRGLALILCREAELLDSEASQNQWRSIFPAENRSLSALADTPTVTRPLRAGSKIQSLSPAQTREGSVTVLNSSSPLILDWTQPLVANDISAGNALGAFHESRGQAG